MSTRASNEEAVSNPASNDESREGGNNSRLPSEQLIDDSERKPETAVPAKSPLFILLIMMGMVVAGSLCTIVGKIMDQKVRLPETGEDGEISLHETEFKHPLVMNLLMFLGEASLLLVLRLQMASDPVAAASHEQNKLNPVTFAIPALLDTIGSFAGFTGLMLISPSTY